MKILLMILVFFVNNKSYAQTYEEWFQQTKTQKKYLLQQIAALKVYIGYAEKGYSIATKGLHTIQDIKHGDFNLHNNFFNSLSAVNPTVKKYSKVASIILMQISIAKQVHTTIKDCRNGKQLTDTELKYLQHVFDNLLDDCVKNLDELIALITDGETQMKDDERIKRIDKLYADMQDKQVFTQSFSHTAKGLSVQRRNDAYDIEIEKKLNGLK
ncbi:MAG TPA: hypothetical protein VIM07_14350 [Chitinophagaceae bacterium]